jgi:hypothetical protein
MLKSISNFRKLISGQSTHISVLPESIGHLIWPLEVYSWSNTCNICNQPLSGTIVQFHGNSVHYACYHNLGITKLENLD